jgi:hypothetical protein
MITKYNTYIIENNYFNDIEYTIENFIFDYLKNNNTNKYVIITDVRDNVIDIETVLNFLIFRIYFKKNFIIIKFLNKDSNSFYYNDNISTLKLIKEYLDNFYVYLLNYISNNDIDLEDIPVIDIEKYLDFMEYLFLNYKKIKILNDNYIDIITYFIKNVYNNSYYSDLKEKFNKRFDHYIHAKNFDLI